MTVSEFTKKHSFNLVWKESTPPQSRAEHWDNKATHYKVSVNCGGINVFKSWYSKGGGLEKGVGLNEVLLCLSSDCSSYENAKDLAGFLCEFGYNQDEKNIRHGILAFNDCKKTADRARDYFGGNYQEFLEIEESE